MKNEGIEIKWADKTWWSRKWIKKEKKTWRKKNYKRWAMKNKRMNDNMDDGNKNVELLV